MGTCEYSIIFRDEICLNKWRICNQRHSHQFEKFASKAKLLHSKTHVKFIMSGDCGVGVVVHVQTVLKSTFHFFIFFLLPSNSSAAGCRCADAIEFLRLFADFLSQQRVPAVILLECASSTDDATAQRLLLPHCTAPTLRLSLIQPINSETAVNAAISLLNLPPRHVAILRCIHAPETETENETAPMPSCSTTATLPIHPTASPQHLMALSVFHVAKLIKQTSAALCVGYAMKASRQTTLLHQGMLPFLPVDDVFFLPIDFHALPPHISSDFIQNLDVFLHKGSDFLEENENPSDGSGAVPPFQPSFVAFLHRLHPDCVVIDPLALLTVVLDRVEMAAALDAACKAARKLAMPVRAPLSHLIPSAHFLTPSLARTAATASGVSLPCVLKPQVACGIHAAHQMAFVLHPSGLHSALDVPLPALLQEYVDHHSVVWKVYVIGKQVFTAQKRSTPDLHALKDYLAGGGSAIDGLPMKNDEDVIMMLTNKNGGGEKNNRKNGVGNEGVVVVAENEQHSNDDVVAEMDGDGGVEDFPASIEFNSLESLPVNLPWLRKLHAHEGRGEGEEPEKAEEVEAEHRHADAPLLPLQTATAGFMRPDFLARLAEVLRRQVGLTLFGFDVVFDFSAGEAVVLDLNFFPSYRGIPEAPAALRSALRQCWKERTLS